jgi:acyl-coenzyme A synthetase/AMP-(fatty) acid ligase
MNLADIIGGHAAQRPDAPAVIERGQTWNYREFDAAVDAGVAWLRESGVAPGDVIGVSLPSGALHLAVMYALARAGAIYLTLALREPHAKRVALARRLGAKGVIGAGAQAQLDSLPLLEPGPEMLEARGTPAGGASVGGNGPWRYFLTSGTTGAPRAVLFTHAMQAFWCEANQAAVPTQHGDRYLAVLDLSFDAGLRHCLCIHWGGGAVMFEQVTSAPEEFLPMLDRIGVNYLGLTPVHLRSLLSVCREERAHLPAIRILRSGGMVHSDPLCRAVRRRLTPNFYVMYGTNDGGSPFSFATPDTQSRHPNSVGCACAGVELGIAGDNGEALAPGEAGLVRVRAAGIGHGYADDPAATAWNFRGGWYYPGDMGRMSADGALYLLGRADDMMNYDGIKIYPMEIENVLQEHPAVAEAAAFAVRSKIRQDLPHAAVVLRHPVGNAELREFCTQALGTRAPIGIAFFDRLPRTPAGKIDKRALAERIEQESKRGR